MGGRTLAVGVSAALIAAGCSDPAPQEAGPETTVSTASSSPTTRDTAATDPAPTSQPTTTERTTSTPSTVPALDAVPLYEPSDSDVLLERKRLGGRFAQALLTYGPTATAESHTQDLIEGFDLEPDPLASAQMNALAGEAMVVGSQSAATVRYVQMGGNRESKASLMVWVDVEMLSPDGELSSESRVVDVRVHLVDEIWVVDELKSAGGPKVERPGDLSELAVEVVDHLKISMPDSARWDIYSGHTTDRMLRRMLEVAEITDYAVLVLSRGHPYRVFATDSVSRHSTGDAMDVYEVGGQLVVESRFEDSPTWTLAKTLFDNGIGSIGSPWAFDGFGGRSFTDDVHQDHLHITAL